VERRLNERMESQRISYEEQPPRLVTVVDEAALRRQVGTRKVVCDQTTHLARITTEHPRIRLHVVPSSAQEYPGLGRPFILATLREGIDLAFLGTHVGGQELDQPEDLGRLQRVWEATPWRGVAPAGVHRAGEGSGGVVALAGATWRKSSRSVQSNDCVEVATNFPDVVGVRDSKDPAGPVLTFDPYAWQAFLAAPPS
jgi:hypothetical protein